MSPEIIENMLVSDCFATPVAQIQSIFKKSHPHQSDKCNLFIVLRDGTTHEVYEVSSWDVSHVLKTYSEHLKLRKVEREAAEQYLPQYSEHAA